MCNGDKRRANKILKHFSSHAKSLAHERHFSIDTAKSLGMAIVDLEADHTLQENVLSLHHAFMYTFSNSNTLKIIENQLGVAYVETLPRQMPQQFLMQAPHADKL